MPFDVEFKVTVDRTEILDSLRKLIRTQVIENGLDKELSKDLQELKDSLKQNVVNKIQVKGVNGKIEAIDTADSPNAVASGGESTVSKAKSDLYKFIFDIDITKIPTNSNYTKSTDGHIFVLQNGLVKYRAPVSEYSDYFIEQGLASERMRKSAYYDPGKNRFYVPAANAPFAKPECSNQPGDHDRSQKVFESRKNSKAKSHADAIGDTGIGNFVTWTMFKRDMDQVLAGSVDATEVIDKILDGKAEEALQLFEEKTKKNAQGFTQIKSKLEKIRDNKQVTPDIATYNNIQTLIKNLKIKKDVFESGVTYSLVSNYTDSEEMLPFIEEIQNQIGIWSGAHEALWIDTLGKAIIREIKRVMERL